MPLPLVAEIRTDAIRRNLDAIRRRVGPDRPICAAVKADAYGHGLRQVLPALEQARVERLAVATLAEALQLRSLGWAGPILCFGPVTTARDERSRSQCAAEAVAADVICTVTALADARPLAQAAARAGRVARVEIQIDSGMGRFGLLTDHAAQRVADLARLPGLTLAGIYTHFATADEPDLGFTREQLRRFSDLIRNLEALSITVPTRHAANSAAIFRLPESHLDMVRPGLSVYGYWGGPDDERPPDLSPCLRVVSRLDAVRRLPAGHAVGYGRTFVTERESLIGTVPIGYADGYRRLLGNDAVVTLLAKGGRPRCTAPVVGRVSMDQINVDLAGIPEVEVGDPVTIIDDDPDAPNSVETLARRLDSIPYEITTLLGPRIHRVAVR